MYPLLVIIGYEGVCKFFARAILRLCFCFILLFQLF
jgi:hypothetical protein